MNRARWIIGALLTLTLCASTNAEIRSTANPSRAPSYDGFLNRLNPSNFNYGRWLQQRSEALREATVDQPQFWYSSAVTVCCLAFMATCAKLAVDNRRRMRITAEMMADLYTHDAYSREVAREAIQVHNIHIEQCNRAEEASQGSDGRPGWGDTRIDALKAELERVVNELEGTTQERNKLQDELRQKALIVSDLSTRLDALSKKLKTPEPHIANTDMSQGSKENGVAAPLVGHINRLQEELYAERQKNRRLKGA